MRGIGLGRVDYRIIDAEVMHKPSGRFGVVSSVLPPDGVYVDFDGIVELHDSEDLTL